MARVLSTAFVLALVAATVGAFALTQGAKTELSPIFAPAIDKEFSPNCDCDKRVARIDFKLRKGDRIEVWMERDGDRADTLVSGRSYPAGKVQLAFDGITEAGLALPDGVYKPVVRLTGSHRTIRLPNPIVLDTKPPRITVPRPVRAIISPDGDGRKDSFRAPYELNERAHAILFANDRRVLYTRTQQAEGSLFWNGKLDGRPVRPGVYVMEASAQDVAGNRTEPFAFAIVQVRYVALGRPRVIARPGGRFAIRVSTDAPIVRWRLNGRTGTAPRGTLRLRAPRRAGVYRLFVSANGRAAKATVVVA